MYRFVADKFHNTWAYSSFRRILEWDPSMFVFFFWLLLVSFSRILYYSRIEQQQRVWPFERHPVRVSVATLWCLRFFFHPCRQIEIVQHEATRWPPHLESSITHFSLSCFFLITHSIISALERASLIIRVVTDQPWSKPWPCLRIGHSQLPNLWTGSFCPSFTVSRSVSRPVALTVGNVCAEGANVRTLNPFTDLSTLLHFAWKDWVKQCKNVSVAVEIRTVFVPNQNDGKLLPGYTAQQTRRQPSSIHMNHLQL
jgi:hypothetical protein